MKRLALGALHESQNRLRQSFVAFASHWQAAKGVWRDEPARQFEQRHLSHLSPTLKRVSAAAEEFAEIARHAETLVADPDQRPDD